MMALSSLAPIETAEESPADRSNPRSICCLYLVLDGERPLAGGSRFDLSRTDEVVFGRGDDFRATRDTREGTRRLIVTAPTATLSAKHCRLLRVGDAWAIQDRGSRNGTWLNAARIDYAELADKDSFQIGRHFYLFRRHTLPPSTAPLLDRIDVVSNEPYPSLVSLNPELIGSYESLESIAKSKLSVLLLGGTGTGKDVTARAVHALSKRPGQFCPVNCGAIPAGLVESTLFGHVKGAFTGAVSSREGYVRAADGGTLFLDEIGDLPLAAQATLLRVLQDGNVTPVGTAQSTSVDIRIVAATHQPLEELVRQRKFREDLLARLSGYVHRLWPLESRIEDFGVLFASLLKRAAGHSASRVTVTTDAGWALLRYVWPRNVRELEQSILRAVVLGDGEQLDVRHFPNLGESAARTTRSSRPPSGVHTKVSPSVEVALRSQLDELMRQYRGNVAAVARELGKGPTQIQRWLKRVGLVAARYRG